MNFKKYKLLLILLILTIGCLGFSDNLKQDNREELFLSSEYEAELISDRLQNPSYDSFVFSVDFDKQESLDNFDEYFEILEDDFEDFFWMSPNKISNLSNLEEQNEFFKDSKLLKLIEENNSLYFIHYSGQTPKNRARLISSLNRRASELGLSLKWAGMPYLNSKLGEMALSIKKVVMPLLFISVAIVLRFILGSNLLTILAFIPSLFGVGVSLVVIKLIWGYSTMITTLVPILIFLVLLSVTLHLICTASYLKDISKAWIEKRKAIFLALYTTLLGLLSLCLSDIPAIRQFSITSSLSLSISSFIAIFVLLKLDFSDSPSIKEKVDLMKYSFKSSFNLQVVILVLISVLGFWSWKHLPFQVEALYFFPEQSQIVKDWRFTEARLGGLPLLDIHVHGDNLLTSKKLQEISDFEKALSNSLPSKFKIVSPNAIVMEANTQYTGSKKLPDNKIAYDALLSRVPRYFRPNHHEDQYTMSILGPTLTTGEYEDLIMTLDEQRQSFDMSSKYGGLYFWLMNSQKELITSMTKSFLFGLILVTFFVFFMLRSVSSGIVFFLINIIPALGTLSIFYLLGKPLNVASITTFSISFGLIVDSTLHLMIHYKKYGFKRDDFIKKTIFTPMWIVTTVMVFGFMGLGFHSFAPVGDFGLAMGITLCIAFLLDFIVLPSFEEKINPTT